VHTKNRKFVVRNSLLQLSVQLAAHNFVKCHKKYMVNLDFVQGFNGKFLFLEGLQIPVSRTMKELVLEGLNK
jgi:DNA-binding LytR/AlgR family response regulator